MRPFSDPREDERMPGKAPALEKGLKIIELLLGASEPLTLSLIATSLDYKVSEIQRMVEYLAEESFIARTAAGGYLPGSRSFDLSDRSREAILVAKAEGPMRRYSQRFAASVHLGVLVETSLHVVFGVDGGVMVRVSVKPGLYEASDTVSGRLLLAYRRPELAGEEGEEAREKGWAFGEIACAQGVYVVGVPLPMGRDSCAAVLSSPYLLTGPGRPQPRLDLVEGLVAVAAEIGA
jgi:DNA-binding IclR family transcriptional regulator